MINVPNHIVSKMTKYHADIKMKILIFNIFFVFEKLPVVFLRDVCPPVCLSVCSPVVPLAY